MGAVDLQKAIAFPDQQFYKIIGRNPVPRLHYIETTKVGSCRV